MTVAELKSLITDQQFKLKKARTRGMMVAQETERMSNLLVNYMDDIISALDLAINAEKKIELLTVEIDSSDAELREKDDEIRSLKEKLESESVDVE